MLRKNSPFPTVSRVLKETRDYTFRGNTFGQVGAFYSVSPEEREIASRFDVAEAIRVLEEQIRQAA